MFTFQNQAPASSSRLLQCGYRSKVCTSPRATKIDGSLHKLCDFHRRKANLSQQRLHQRRRAARQRREAMVEAPQDPITIDPIPYVATDPVTAGLNSSGFKPVEVSMLELFMEPLPAEQTGQVSTELH